MSDYQEHLGELARLQSEAVHAYLAALERIETRAAECGFDTNRLDGILPRVEVVVPASMLEPPARCRYVLAPPFDVMAPGARCQLDEGHEAVWHEYRVEENGALKQRMVWR
jgi:hypothetical protein